MGFSSSWGFVLKFSVFVIALQASAQWCIWMNKNTKYTPCMPRALSTALAFFAARSANSSRCYNRSRKRGNIQLDKGGYDLFSQFQSLQPLSFNSPFLFGLLFLQITLSKAGQVSSVWAFSTVCAVDLQIHTPSWFIIEDNLRYLGFFGSFFCSVYFLRVSEQRCVGGGHRGRLLT
jgi:hypothetical protein